MVDIERIDLGSSLVDYHHAWEHQRAVHADVVAGRRDSTLLMLEHESVYTAGKRTSQAERPSGDLGAAVVDVDRGGRITWHGPGQLVVYPIITLRAPIDVVAYVRSLEEAVIAVAARFGVGAGRVAGRSGVWVHADPEAGIDRDRKLCAIGVRVAKGVTMHGIALNCDADLGAFTTIIPCGIEDADVTSLSVESGRNLGVLDVAGVVEEELVKALTPLIREPARQPAGA